MEDGFDPFDNPNLQVTGAEAYQTDEENYTHYEGEGTGKNGDCLPDDVVCQGSPIVLNLTHGPYVFTDAADGVHFKLEPTGEAQAMAWTAAGTEQAFLWLDRNGNGTVDDGSELFGNFTRLQDGTRARNGFEALRELDANHDGIIDEQDPIWNSLQLWTDRNHNGVAEPDEVMPISASRIKRITLDYHWTGHRDQFGNVLRYQAGMIIENSRGVQQYRPIYDIYFVRATK
jgi:hypothetical protein